MSRDGDMVPVDTSEVFRGNRNSLQSWIRIDATGQYRELDLDKYEIMRRVQIHARDLRILDPNISSPSSILSREKAIVLNLEHIRVIITAEEVLLRRSLDENIIPVVEEFKRRLDVESRARYGQADGNEDSGAEDDDADAAEKDESPFEFRALEVALEAICSFLAARTTELETSAYPALDELTSKTSSRNLDRMRVLKNNMTKLTVRVQKVKDELEQLLDEEDDMADLYLSRKLAGASSPVSDSNEPINSCPTSPTIAAKISRAKSHLVNPLAAIHGKGHNDVEEIEMLLEAYYMQIDSTLNKLTTLREYIDDTEDYINIQLDTFRNQLMKVELILSAGSICVSVYSLVAGILGMNIPFSWNKKEFMFKWVVSVTGTLCAVLFVVIMSYARYKRLVGT